MKIIHSTDPSILELRADVLGCVVFAGLIFTAGGGAALAFALDKIPVDVFVEPELKYAALAAGAVGLLIGLSCIGGRSGKIFDRHQRSLTTWSGFFVPMRRKQLRLDEYSRVVLSKEVRRSNKTSTTVYPVQLQGVADRPLNVDTPTDYLEARRLAEAVAKVLHWPMTDSSSGEAVVREPDRVDESLRDRMRRLGDRIELAPRPHTMRSQAQVGSSEVQVEIPGMSSKARLIMNLSVIAIALGIAVFFFGMPILRFGDFSSPDTLLQLLPAVFVAVPMIIVLSKLSTFNQQVLIVANRASLRVTEGRKTTEIPGDELEELTLAGRDMGQMFEAQPDGSLVVKPEMIDSHEGASYSAKHGQPPSVPPALAGVVQTLSGLSSERLSILARSDRASVRFGGTLEGDELTYLFSAIMKVMTD